jgi:hypothetical protein
VPVESEFERAFTAALLTSWERRQKELPESDEARAMALIGYIFGAEDALLSIGILTRGIAAHVAKRGISHLLDSADPSLIRRVTMNAPPRIDLSGTRQEGDEGG